MALETDKKGGFKVKLTSTQLSTGMFVGTFESDVPFGGPLWESLESVRPGTNGIEKIKGPARVLADTTSSGPIRGIITKLSATSRLVYYGDLTTIFEYDTTTDTLDTVGTGYTGFLNSGVTEWDSGTTTWDSGTTLWDDGIVRASLWSIVTFDDAILATNGKDQPQLLDTNETFNGLTDGVIKVTIDTAGSGYLVGEAVTASGGGGSGFAGEISQVGGSGEIEAVRITDGGSGYTSIPTLSITTAGGTGGALTAEIGVLQQLDVDTIEIFQVRGPHVLGFNTSNDSREFIWCSAGDPTDWVPTQTNTAGFLKIRELASPIVAAAPLGDQILVYGQDQVFAVTLVGTPFIFNYRPIVDGIGAVSKRSVVSIGRRHVGLSNQGFFITDGTSFQYIDEPMVRSFYEGQRAEGQLAKVVAFHNEQYNEVRFSFPTGSGTTMTVLAYNYDTGAWYQPEPDNITYGVARTLFSQPVVARDTELFFLNASDNNDGAAIAATATTHPMDMGEPNRIKEIDQIRIGFSGSGDGLTVEVGWAETQAGPFTFGSRLPVSAGFPEIHTRVAGRWLQLKVSSRGTLNTDWTVSSVQLIGRFEGSR